MNRKTSNKLRLVTPIGCALVLGGMVVASLFITGHWEDALLVAIVISLLVFT